jgi:hypothetical protein
MDLEITGIGNLNICKAYGAKVLIQAHVTAETNNTKKDIIPHLSLDIDCCQFEGKKCKS